MCYPASVEHLSAWELVPYRVRHLGAEKGNFKYIHVSTFVGIHTHFHSHVVKSLAPQTSHCKPVWESAGAWLLTHLAWWRQQGQGDCAHLIGTAQEVTPPPMQGQVGQGYSCAVLPPCTASA